MEYVVDTSVRSQQCTVFCRVNGMLYNVHLLTVHSYSILYVV